jgi:hypothetical protein
MPTRTTTHVLTVPIGWGRMERDEAEQWGAERVKAALGPTERIVGDPAFEVVELPAQWGGTAWRWTWTIEFDIE